MTNVPRGPLPLSVPLVPSVKAASISFQRQKRKSHHVEFWKKKSQSMETEGEGRLAKRVMEQRDTGAGGPMGSREISFGRERMFH